MIQPTNYSEFGSTLNADLPSKDWPISLQALWYDAKDNWNAAHEIVDGKNDSISKWIHAYLHRKEGDEWNAGYWYRQVGKPFPSISLEEEHVELVSSILNSSFFQDS